MRITGSLFDRLLVALYVALAAVPVIAMSAKIRGRELVGVLPPTPRPKLAWQPILAEQYQRELTSWFESNLGLKGTSIALDNAILYHVFRETKFGSTALLGKDGVLFPADDIGFFNKHGQWITDPAFVDKLAGQMALLQRKLSARGRALVPVMVPSKSTIWRDKIPDRWKMDLPEPRPSDETRRLVREALARHGVKYVDAIALLEQRPESRNDLFGPDGRHWTIFSACLAMREAAGVYAELTGKPRPKHECELVRSGPRRHDDADIFNLLNTSWIHRGYKPLVLVRHPGPPEGVAPPPGTWPAPPNPNGPSLLVVATSFGWTMFFDAEDSGLYGPIHLNYYNKTFAAQDGTRTEVQVGSRSWQEIVMSKDYYVLDLFESYLAPGAYVESFLADLIAELEKPAAPTSPGP